MSSLGKKNPFIKLPNKLLWTNKQDEKSLVEQASELLSDETTATLLPEVLTQLNWRINRMNTCIFTIGGLIKSCGYVPKTGNNKSINKFREILILLHEWEFIKLDSEEALETISTSTEIVCSISNNFNTKNGEDIEFFTLDLEVYNALIKACTSSSLKRNLLNIYFYLSARIPASSYGKCFCYVGQGEIAATLQVTRPTVLSCLKILEDLKLIYFGNIGTLTGTNKKGEASTIFGKTVYAKTLTDLEEGLACSESFYMSKRYTLDTIKEEAKKVITKSRSSKGGKKP